MHWLTQSYQTDLSTSIHKCHKICQVYYLLFQNIQKKTDHTPLTVYHGCLFKLSIYMVGIFLSTGFFFKFYFLKKLKFYQSQSNSLESDQARRAVGPDLGANCLQN